MRCINSPLTLQIYVLYAFNKLLSIVLSCGAVGNFCPVCRRCYMADDWESQMMQCCTCHHWVHASCEQLTGITTTTTKQRN